MSTYSGAVNLINEYNVILSASEFPDSKFMVRAAVIDRQIAEWFSPSTFVAWSEAHGAACRKKRVRTIKRISLS